MGRRDFRHRETKKPKKDAKKLLPQITILPAPINVEVVKKKKKTREEENEE